jgi:hypothetical protein
MSRTSHIIALLGTIGIVACGATTRDQGSPQVSSPPTSNRPGTTAQSGPTEVASGQRGSIPTGTELDVRLQTALSSETAKAEQRFEATTAVDVQQDGRVIIPAGSVVRGVVSSVNPADRLNRAGSLTLSFDRLTVNRREIPIRATATEVFKSGGIREEAGTAGAGAGVGGIIGGILGGVKGAVLGAVIGAGGAIAATDGKDIELAPGSVIRIRFDSAARVS